MTLVGLPGLEVIASGDEIKTGLLGCRAEFHELWHGKLLVCQHESDLAFVPGRYTDVARASILSKRTACRKEGGCADQSTGGLQDGAPIHGPRGLVALKALS
jgi:hypothetical protein